MQLVCVKFCQLTRCAESSLTSRVRTLHGDIVMLSNGKAARVWATLSWLHRISIHHWSCARLLHWIHPTVKRFWELQCGIAVPFSSTLSFLLLAIVWMHCNNWNTHWRLSKNVVVGFYELSILNEKSHSQKKILYVTWMVVVTFHKTDKNIRQSCKQW